MQQSCLSLTLPPTPPPRYRLEIAPCRLPFHLPDDRMLVSGVGGPYDTAPLTRRTPAPALGDEDDDQIAAPASAVSAAAVGAAFGSAGGPVGAAVGAAVGVAVAVVGRSPTDMAAAGEDATAPHMPTYSTGDAVVVGQVGVKGKPWPHLHPPRLRHMLSAVTRFRRVRLGRVCVSAVMRVVRQVAPIVIAFVVGRAVSRVGVIKKAEEDVVLV